MMVSSSRWPSLLEERHSIPENASPNRKASQHAAGNMKETVPCEHSNRTPYNWLLYEINHQFLVKFSGLLKVRSTTLAVARCLTVIGFSVSQIDTLV